jgi:hypothetical protein
MQTQTRFHDGVRGGRAGRQQIFAWLALSFTVGLVGLVYLSLSRSTSADPLLMPLDDTYIHFQYARQMAQGHPMVYHDGDPATSGGTSVIYPLLLAVGYKLGFTGWALTYWALVLGALFFFGSTWLVYLIARSNPLIPEQADQPYHALALALVFALSGPFIWAALSGMETALFVFVVLLALYLFQCELFRLTGLAGVLMTLTRPEGLLLAGIMVGALALHKPHPLENRNEPQRRRGRRDFLREKERKRVTTEVTENTERIKVSAGEKQEKSGFWLWLALPLLAGLVQPIINLVATGSLSSSGMVAKSRLYNTSIPLRERLSGVLESLWRMWRELITGYTPDFGRLTPFLMAAFAVFVLGAFAVPVWRKRRDAVAALILLWMLALSAGVATLDTAFWQFRRYQLPIMALMFPVAGWGTALVGDFLVRRFKWRGLRWALPAVFLISSALTALAFASNYAGNVRVVRDQQVPMARWVKANLPEGTRVGAHDVGLMAYFSGHPLYDVVGLTTPGPAESWRQGPGAIYEYMASSAYRPDYFAIYPDVQGLSYLRDAGVFGAVLAEFPVEFPEHNVASAADYQAVYVADWSNTREKEQVAQASTLDEIAGMELVDQIDVANLDSEAAHDYRWWQDETPPGFVTEVYKNMYQACGLEDESACWATDGGRVLTGGEEFTIKTIPGQDLLLVTRVHGRESVPLIVSIGDVRLAYPVQPAVPGRWLEVVTLIEGAHIANRETRIRIEAQGSAGAYSPYYHWAYQGNFTVSDVPEPVARFDQAGSMRLLSYEIDRALGPVNVTLTWAGPAPDTGDGVVFVHLYNQDNIHTEPVAQVVGRPGGGALPPGNWLPGEIIHDTYTLPGDLPPGTYEVAIGIFDARTGERYPVQSDTLRVDDNRLFIGTIQEQGP